MFKTLKNGKYPAKHLWTRTKLMTVFLANAPAQAETLLQSLEQSAAGIGLHVNRHKTEYMSLNQRGDISTQNGSFLKLVGKFTYLESSVSSIEIGMNTWLGKHGQLSIGYRSYGCQTWPIKSNAAFFQAAVASILLYGCITWKLTKRREKKIDSNYTRMLRAILNKSWRQHPSKQQLYGYLPPIMKRFQIRNAAFFKQWSCLYCYMVALHGR